MSSNGEAIERSHQSEPINSYKITSKEATEDSADASEDSTGRRRSNYSVKKKRELIALAQVAGIREVCQLEGVPRRTMRHWLRDAEKINNFEGPDTRKSIGRLGRRELLPFGQKLSKFLEKGRSEGRDITSSHMIEYIRQEHAEWLECYMADKSSTESGHAALARLCQRFVERHGITQPESDSILTRHSTLMPDMTATACKKQSTKVTLSSNDMQTSTQLNMLECERGDNTPLLFGLDIGTSAIKCVVVKAKGRETVATTNVSLKEVTVSARSNDKIAKYKEGVQNVDQILLAVQRAIEMLPESVRRRVSSIGICGQMHGIVWWCSHAVHESADLLLKARGSCIYKSEDTLDPAWSELITWQDQRCTASFIKKCREKVSSFHTAETSAICSPIAAGYGLASYSHILEHSSHTLVGMDACGTIQDFVAFVLCGHTLSSETAMDTTNAHSWGGFNMNTLAWDSHVLRALRIPFSMLPTVKKPGSCIGHTCTGYTAFGLPFQKPVYVPMGDHPCSVLAAILKSQSALGKDLKLTLVNIGTSAQLAMVLTDADVVKLPFGPKSDSLTRKQGNLSFEQWQNWTKEMGLASADNGDEESATQRDAEVYARLIQLGMQHQNTQLTFVPTLNGERADPDATGSILNLRMNNWSMGDITAALSRGLVDNLFAMIPTEVQALISTQPIIGTGNALVRNELIQRFLRCRLANPQNLHLQTTADAAVGASLAPLLVDYAV
ncbi:Ribulose kinase and related carbohydrate kinases [Plasmopara halstedii]|uniref:Ribulose kinase and related carbohydrate kinases n=1 Tax=Plasmopara halstedii TaxID=4781 RepID=A0A0P1AJX8_PLAHL|nr:Ribulose kinase and related carbohydrate kinases [Plasmopara halstedii]CEG41128.1 Ribulose kinase and related carbohydrate kinases [Plasmopara halstedii]|eukprot:XP_024577497.1 Ribulose kinase and related carbohydrate kinases [Plasmopara halstedii]